MIAVLDPGGNVRSISAYPAADELPEGWTVREIADPPEGGGVLDAETLTWGPHPVSDEPVSVLSDADVDRIATALAAKLRG